MNGETGGAGAILAKFFYGAAAVFGVTFVVAAIIDGYEAEIHMRDPEMFTPHGTVLFIIAAVFMVAGVIVSLRNKRQ